MNKKRVDKFNPRWYNGIIKRKVVLNYEPINNRTI